MAVFWDKQKLGPGASLADDGLTGTTSAGGTLRSTIARSAGKWFWEVQFVSGSYPMIGVVNETAGVGFTHTNANARYYYVNGLKYPTAQTYGAAYTTGDTIGILLDLDLGEISFYKNGVPQGIAYNNLKTLGPIYAAINGGSSSMNMTARANFGATPFKYVPESLPVGTLAFDGTNFLAVNKSLIYHEEEYKTIVSNYITDFLTMPYDTLVMSTSSVVTRAAHILFDKDIIISEIGYYAGQNGSMNLRIYNKDTQQLIYSQAFNMVKGLNKITIGNLFLKGGGNYLIGLYGAGIYGRTIPLPNIIKSESEHVNATVFMRYDGDADAFPKTATSTTMPIFTFRFNAKIHESSYWEFVSNTIPSKEQFEEKGMESLSPALDRSLKILNPISMIEDTTLLAPGDVGKTYVQTIDLSIYTEIKQIRIGVNTP